MLRALSNFVVRTIMILHVLTGYLLIARAVGFAVPMVDLRTSHYRWLPTDLAHLAGGGLIAGLIYVSANDGRACRSRNFLIAQGLLTVYLTWWVFWSIGGRPGDDSMGSFFAVWSLLVVPPHLNPITVGRESQSAVRAGRLWRLLAVGTASVAALVVVADFSLPDGPAYQPAVSALSWTWFAVMLLSAYDVSQGRTRSLPAGLATAASISLLQLATWKSLGLGDW